MGQRKYWVARILNWDRVEIQAVQDIDFLSCEALSEYRGKAVGIVRIQAQNKAEARKAFRELERNFQK